MCTRSAYLTENPVNLYALQIAYTQLWFVYHKHTHTRDTFITISYTHICVTPPSVPLLVSTLTDGLVCESIAAS